MIQAREELGACMEHSSSVLLRGIYVQTFWTFRMRNGRKVATSQTQGKFSIVQKITHLDPYDPFVEFEDFH